MGIQDGGLERLHAAEPQGRVSDYLALVADMSRQFAGSLDIQETVRLALRRIADYLDAEAGSVFLLDKSGQKLGCHACVGPVDISGLELPATAGIVGKSIRENRTLIVRDARSDPDFAGQVDEATGFETKSILCAPLSVTDEVLGCIELINKQGGRLFDTRDQSVLEALGAAAAMALFNARQARALVDQQRLAREVELAQEIQRGLLPAAAGACDPVHGFNLPARMVSGDFYDYVTCPDGRISFMLADVSGKGMNAALLMAKTASLFHLLAKSGRLPSEMAALINDEIQETALRGMFVTAVIGVYDPVTGWARLANAGHEPALVVDALGRRHEVEADAPPLGILPVDGDPSAFPVRDIDLRGGALYLFTDGMTEGRISDGTMFGRERLDALISAVHDVTLPQRLSAIAGPILRRPEPLHDDITLLVIDDRPLDANRPLPELQRRLLPALSTSLAEIRAMMRDGLERVGCSGVPQYDLVLAVDEAVQNIIRHGYCGGDGAEQVEFVLRGRADMIEVSLLDTAPQIDPELICPRDLSEVRPGGLGVNLICQIMDDVVFMARPDGKPGNLLKMRRKIA